MGFGLARPRPLAASSKARAVHFWSSAKSCIWSMALTEKPRVSRQNRPGRPELQSFAVDQTKPSDLWTFRAASRDSIEERIDKCLRIEGHEVVGRFAGTNEGNRQAQFAHDGNDDAAASGAIELGEHDARDAGGGGEFARLRAAVLTGRCGENQEA